MEKQDFLKSKTFKAFVILFTVACIIKIFSGGYEAGQWLYSMTH